MLKVVLWKIGCEWAHLIRALWPCADRKVYYFAFGANLSQQVLTQRRIKVFEVFDYILKDAALRFSQPGFYHEHGYASADSAAGEVVYGRMYLILERDALRMDYFEGVPYFEVHEKVIRVEDDLEFYYYRTTRHAEGLKPTQEYLDYILTAYREMDIVPDQYLKSLESTEVLQHFVADDRTGTFVENLDAWPLLLQPLLIRYERLCSRMVEFLWHRSPLQWMIRL